ncbi:slit homolog 3 protein-like [Atheta coriaria]|uniref:slit homolog 3 protein-like n=1 Tax=Dalotia coriaria TaxID=877792 RepID=UPI0031F3F2BC
MHDNDNMEGKVKRSIVSIVLVTLVLVRRTGVQGASLNCEPGCRCTGIEIDCSNSDLDVVPDLKNIQGANIVDLSNNRIEELEDELPWMGIEQLQFLYFNTNSIYLVSDLAFDRLVNLEYLDLSSNYMELLPDTLFSSNPRLHTLILQGNLFQSNTPRIHSSSIRHLDLSFCKLSTFTVENIKNLPSLTTLNLQVNNLVYLQPEVFNQHPGISLSLSYNYWACNCSTVELYKWALDNQPRVIIDEKCNNKNNIHVNLFNRTREFLYKEKCDIDEDTFGTKPMKNLSLTRSPTNTTNSSVFLNDSDDDESSSSEDDEWLIDAWIIFVIIALVIILVAVALGVVLGVFVGRLLQTRDYRNYRRSSSPTFV